MQPFSADCGLPPRPPLSQNRIHGNSGIDGGPNTSCSGRSRGLRNSVKARAQRRRRKEQGTEKETESIPAPVASKVSAASLLSPAHAAEGAAHVAPTRGQAEKARGSGGDGAEITGNSGQ